MPDWPGVIIAFVFGIVVGSFLNVCIWRLPRDESLAYPGSHCPQCDTLLRPWDLVPLLSFLIQRRRCRYCRAPITWRYFGVELLTGVYFVLVFLRFGWMADTIFYALFGAALIAIFFIDLEHYIIPDQLSLFIVGLGLLRDGIRLANGVGHPYHIPIPWTGVRVPVPQSLAGMLICGCAFAAVAIIAYYLFQKEGLGGGDIKLAAGIGAMLGTGLAMISFFLAVVGGLIVILPLMALGKKSRHDMVPFGPMMVGGAILAMFFGRQIWHMYLSWAGLS